MARKTLILSSANPYHVCARTNNRDWFNVPLPKIWKIFCECLQKTQLLYGCEYYAFVLMANHFHLLLGTPQSHIGECMRHLLTESSRRIARASGRINKIYGARYRWSILYGPQDYAYVYKYIYRNPVRASIVSKPEDYPFSTLNQVGHRRCDISVCDRIDQISKCIPKNEIERLRWLNQPTAKEAEALIGRALRRYEFKFTTANSAQAHLRALKAEYGVETETKR